MRSLFRTALSASLTINALIGTSCLTDAAENKSAPRVVRRDQRMLAAQLEETRGHLDEAKRLYTAIHQTNPANAECCHRLGLVYAKLNRYPEAEVFYRKADAINPGNPRLLADRGYSAFQRKDYLQAEEWLEKSVQLDLKFNGGTNNRSTLRNLAIVRAWLNKDQLSLETFRQINEEEEALRNLAAIQIARGDTDLGLRNYELAKNGKRNESTVAEIPVPPAPPSSLADSDSKVTASRISDELPPLLSRPTPTLVELTSQTRVFDPRFGTQSNPTPAVVELTNVPTIDSAMNLIETSQSATERRIIEGNEIVLAPAAPVRESKVELVMTCGRPVATLTTYPLSVTTFTIESSNSSEETQASPSSTVSTVSDLEPPEDLVFELPIPRKLQEEVSDDASLSLTLSDPDPSVTPAESSRPTDGGESRSHDPFVAPISSVAEPNFEDVCLVTLCEERRIVKGSPDFVLEYFGQKYHCSSAEALTKFRAEPQRYVPAAGGLDVVIFRNQREFSQGVLSHASWYRHRLYLFSCPENRAEFKQNPQKYASTE